ncbi:MAG: energy-coupling factor transporter transmembrane component T [Methanobrevibacter sp.]|uniref:energy-coupling factor transporter transmembrane component T n=1 Tax=Methanobrevibacter sp. TaxID=66852 RepID=UPI0026DF4413|nr:energy-coupling factor transporter transmembrane component T [Methanobrevibacter sp.]MDO5848191.1 energy-coupling factor transporter transmembrane component T [Methanobrevibacter sp.]
MELTEIHPGILIAYYVLLAVFSFVFTNPYYMITFILMILLLIYLQGGKKDILNQIKIFIPIGIFIVVLNFLFNYTGDNRIYIWGSYFITIEAVSYGFIMAGSFFLILLTLNSYNQMVSYQEMLYILSKKFPIISMILVMALRFIPLLEKRTVEVSNLMKLEEKDKTGENSKFDKLKERIKKVGNIMGVTVAWSLEEAMLTAKSMKARGYLSSKRTSYLKYTMNKADYCFILLMAITLTVLIYGLIYGNGYISIYPKMNFSWNDFPLNIYYFAFIVFLLPLIYLELEEVWIWHR